MVTDGRAWGVWELRRYKVKWASFRLIRDGLGVSNWGVQAEGQGKHLSRDGVVRPHPREHREGCSRRQQESLASSVPLQQGSVEARWMVTHWALTSPGSLAHRASLIRHAGFHTCRGAVGMHSLWTVPCLVDGSTRNTGCLGFPFFCWENWGVSKCGTFWISLLSLMEFEFWPQHLKMLLILALHFECEVFGLWAVLPPKRNKLQNVFEGDKLTYICKNSIWEWPLSLKAQLSL